MLKIKVKAVLFDLDGTIADTARDLGNALNRQRQIRGLTPLPIELIRTRASAGARGLLLLGFNIKPDDANYQEMREQFLDFYAQRLCHDTRLFPGIPELLNRLDTYKLPWGIVTNKPARFTNPLIDQLGLAHRTTCIISGDETKHPKPHPEPLLTASKKLGVSPSDCIYLGDDIRDVKASIAAGMLPVIARYGYLGDDQPPESWGTEHIIDHPEKLVTYL